MTARIATFWLATLLLIQPMAHGAESDVPVDAPIVAVTVFPDRAEVTRVLEISLPQGPSTLVVPGLPASLIPESVRVDGDPGKRVLIASVESKKHFAEDTVQEDERRLRRELEALEDQRRAQADRIASLQVRLNFITAIGRELPKTANDEIVRGAMDPDKWRQAWTLLGNGAAEAYSEIHKAEVEQRTIIRKIERTKKDLAQLGTGRKATVEARIKVEATQPATARLRLIYQLPGASWQPLYDARLDSDAETITLAQIGEVRQRTGEDWSNVALTLSTARPALTAQIPDLDTWFVDVLEVLPMSAERQQLRARDNFEVADVVAEAPLKADRNAEPKAAAIVSSEFAAEYRIPGVVDVQSEDAPHKFPIAERRIPARLAVRTVPKVAPVAYLYGDVEYAGEEPLLAGPVSLFRDGAFVGSGAIAMIRPGEEVELSFGVDDRVRVDYRLKEGERSREGIINRDRRIERRYVIEVANHHKRPIDITVLDQLPVPLDERIDVELLKGSTPPTSEDVEGRKGVVAWTYSYAANEQRTIEFGYAVRYPEDAQVPGF